MLMTLSYKVGDDDLLSSAKFSIEVCAQEINNWMILNGLKLNEEKTELLLLSLRQSAQFFIGICSRWR